MVTRLSIGIVVLTVSSGVWAAPAWRDHLDIDLTYRSSAVLEGDRHLDVRLGANVETEPTYQGSDTRTSEVGVFGVVAWREDWGNLFLTGDGLGYSRIIADQFGLLINVEQEDTRELDDDTRLAGLGSQSQELEVEIEGTWFNGPWSVGGAVATATGDKGTVWFVGAGHSWRPRNGSFLTLRFDLSGSSADNQQTDFGITEQQSLGTGYRVFTPGGGLKSAGVSFSFDHQLSRRLFLRGDVSVERLLGDVADSPLVSDIGNRHQIEGSVGVYYRF
ncbi:MAG: MipA/OmpV family protein [Pseudomonadota bacterium]